MAYGVTPAFTPNQFFYNTKVDGEDNGPQRDGALRQPGRSSERCGGWCCVCCGGELVRVLGGRRGRRRLGAACFAARCTVHGAGGGDSHGVGGEPAGAAGGPGGGDAAVEALAVIKIKRIGVPEIYIL